MQNLYHDLETLIAADPALTDDTGKPNKNVLITRAANLDAGFLQLLLSSEPIRRQFFTAVGDTLVFDKVQFQAFVANKAFLPDSYTAFRNTIGLIDGAGRFLSANEEVVLAWPYKDCVLEGGMTKEDVKRDELFWNTTLAPDDITRLLEPKALTGFERWDADAVAAGTPKPVGRIDPATDNLLIKGNNLLALHSLKRRYAGQVKLIYIDPPYNTEDDEFEYNDDFKRSTWLTFMKSRLQAARALLRSDGVIAVQINDIEQAYLKVLMDEAFGNRLLSTVCVKMSHLSGPKMAHKERRIPKIKEYIHIFRVSDGPFKMQPQYVPVSWDEAFERYGSYMIVPEGSRDNPQDWSYVPVAKAMRNEGIDRTDDKAVAAWRIANADRIFRTARNKGAKYEPVPKGQVSLQNGTYVLNNEDINFASEKIRDFGNGPVPSSAIGDIWTDIGINNVSQEGGVDIDMNFGKKPEKLVARLINMFTSPGDLVVDFFVGTGTTAAVAHKAGRRWIAVEQLSYIDKWAKTRLKRVVTGEQSGASGDYSWQGGGAFVYLELAQANEALGVRIRAAEDDAALERVAADVRSRGWWRYAVDQAAWDWTAWAALAFDQRKQLLLDSLDANHLYVNYGDIDDADSGLSAEDVAVTKAFYGETA